MLVCFFGSNPGMAKKFRDGLFVGGLWWEKEDELELYDVRAIVSL